MQESAWNYKFTKCMLPLIFLAVTNEDVGRGESGKHQEKEKSKALLIISQALIPSLLFYGELHS